jgi:hypothetical protein
MSDGWYYADDGKAIGPLNVDGIRSALKHHPTAPQVLVWRNGITDWRPAAEFPELAPQPAPPPIPLAPQFIQTPITEAPNVEPPLSVPPGPVEEEPPKTAGWLGKAGGILVAVITFGIARQSGVGIWIILLCFGAAYLVSRKAWNSDHLVNTATVALGHLIWMVSGVVILFAMGNPTSNAYDTIYDVVFYFVLLTWLLFKPGKAPLWGLIVLQVFSLGFSFMLAQDMPKAMLGYLLLHVFIRVVSLILAGYSIYRLRQASSLSMMRAEVA